MNRYFASARDAARTQLWPLPVAGTVLALVAGISLPYLDAYVDAGLPSWSTAITFGGDADAARTLLAAISGSLITVTALTFSLTVVTLQLASSQFSPRLLRTFTSDIFVQTTLAIFLSTFTFALTVLRAVRSGNQGGAFVNEGGAFVPQISVTVAFVLSIASVLGLVLFLAHLARKIRVETLLRDVHEEIVATVDIATGSLEDARPRPTMPTPPPYAREIAAPSSGFLTSIDEAELRSAAIQADGYLMIDCHPGSSLIEGVPIGAAWTAADRPDDEALDRLQHAARKSIKVGYERTAAQDIGYGLRQLTDVVNKAVSPGINDPTTAVHALGHISAILCQLARRDLRSIVLRGDDEEVRVVLHRPSFAEVVDVAITQPRRYGASDPQVMERLFRLLEELAWHAADESTIRGQLARLRTTVARSDFDDTELMQLERAGAQVEHAITRQPDQSTP